MIYDLEMRNRGSSAVSELGSYSEARSIIEEMERRLLEMIDLDFFQVLRWLHAPRVIGSSPVDEGEGYSHDFMAFPV